jgi:hypothetical protein
VNRQTYDLSYLTENIQLKAKRRQLDTLARSQDVTQQRMGNLEMREQNKAPGPEDSAMAADWSSSADTRKTTSPQKQSTGQGTAP